MQLNHPELSALHAFWTRTGGGRLPARGQLTHADLKPWMGNLAIIRVVPSHGHPSEGRLRVDLVGTRIVEIDGVDSTGRFLDEIAPPHAVGMLLKPYRKVLEHGHPCYDRFTPPSRPLTAVHRLLLPLADDGVTIDRILSGVYAEPGTVGARESVFDLVEGAAARDRWAEPA